MKKFNRFINSIIISEAPKLNSKTATDYLENIFEPEVVLPAAMMQKNLSCVRQSQDTRYVLT